ncbi:hypothetical protein ACFE04_002966 [Oxalis oulophora]
MELSLDLSYVYVPKTISELLQQVSKIESNSVKLSKLDAYVSRLDDEMKKIDAFKRELPLCMILITDAIEMLKMEVVKYKKRLDEENGSDERVDLVNNDCAESNKKDWLSSVQLWSHNTATTTKIDVSDQNQLKLRNEEEDENSIHLGECGSRGGAFIPYKGESPRGSMRTEMKKSRDVVRFPELSLKRSFNESGKFGSGSASFVEQMKMQTQSQPQSCRKQRRCWSPDLHRRFIDALKQLGGPQVATPKQIRELMRVDGLTNDEVKSHLQKYRLHIRKLPPGATGPTDGSWMTEDHPSKDNNENNTKAKISESGSPQGPLSVRGSVKGISLSCGTSMDTEEDEKSDGRNWRGGIHRPSEVDV